MKTGTSNDYHDAWTVGYTPNLVAGVWAGNNDNAAMQRSGSSILAAVPIWSAFMKDALKEFPPETFTNPDPVIVEKPILQGQYLVNNQIHTILYYVNKDDPNGPPPANPASDSQFYNWETGISKWFLNSTSTSLLGSVPIAASTTTP
jgi:membrane carboxypeptidase/penicillin-binding protein